ncbi:MAG TPA: aminotransferase class V-fold PLP-dependent enzyme [Burkholderiales bacterium]|nr:aminotransferase class V-fold PLP-dependent enzyme [Burkholderiales bacterium]
MEKRNAAAQFAAGPRGWLYFDANSIGAMPKAAPTRMARLLAQWRRLRRRGWSDADWLDAPRRLGDKLAPVIGARRGSVVVGDSASVNLHKALTLALQLRPRRAEILSESGTFPTDLYVAEKIARDLGLKLKLVENPAQIESAIGSRTAVVYLSHTDYRSAYRHDLRAITRLAHARGALTVWDLSHSAGAVPTEVGAGQADFAVGCGYKYLCGGPGAPGYLYVAPRLQSKLEPAIQGWFGHAAPMEFEARFRPARGIQRHVVGTPAVSGNVLFEAALDVFSKMRISGLFARHAALSQLLINLAPEELGLASPLDPRRRGGFVAFRCRDAKKLVAELERRRVVASSRPPDIVRFGLSPLYHREADVRELARRLKNALSVAG